MRSDSPDLDLDKILGTTVLFRTKGLAKAKRGLGLYRPVVKDRSLKRPERRLTVRRVSRY
jgi:hypothetical protein